MVKYLLNKEKKDSRVLYEQIFNDTDRFLDYYYSEKIQKNNILVCSQDNKIVSMLHRAPYLLNIKNIKEKVDYLYAIATKSDYRRKGIMKRVLSRAIQDMYNEKLPFTYLVPEDANVYNPHGFRFIYDCAECDYVMHKEVSNLNKDYSITEANEQNFEQLIDFSNKTIRENKEMFLNRDIIYYLDILKRLEAENGTIELLYHTNNLVGYCYVSNELSMEILEFVCSEKVKEIFLSLLSTKYNFNEVKIKGILFPWENCIFKPRIMARIIDIREVAKYINPKKVFSISIQVIDPIIEQNNQVFNFKGKQSGLVIQLTEDKPDIKLEIGELTQWLFSIKEVSKMSSLKRINGVFINDII